MKIKAKWVTLKAFALLAAVITAAILYLPAYGYSVDDFSDVPKGHWAYDAVMTMRELNISAGVGNNEFKPSQGLTVYEFETMLGRMTGIEFSGEPDDRFVTRSEMVEGVVRAMGYERVALEMTSVDSGFSDGSGFNGYLAVAKDLGLIASNSGSYFRPFETATRAQVAVILSNLYALDEREINYVNGFYAIKSGGQINMIDGLNSVCFGWARLEPDGLNMTTANSNEYAMPAGAAGVIDRARKSDAKALLFVAVQETLVDVDEESVQLTEYILSDGQRDRYVSEIVEAVNSNEYGLDFDGVVIDLENMKGEELKQRYNEFLGLLRELLPDKLLYVAVHPARKNQEYYDAYDFRYIGDVADMVILMAHDYNAKRMTEREMETGFTITPLTPIGEVYYAVRAIVDSETGVSDRRKVLLQISFDTAQWKLIDGKVINQDAYRPDYEMLYSRMKRGVDNQYYSGYESPSIEFYNEDDGTDNIIWYEDERSVGAKIRLAELFGIGGISLWRLGNIPNFQNDDNMLNVWNNCIKPLNQ